MDTQKSQQVCVDKVVEALKLIDTQTWLAYRRSGMLWFSVPTPAVDPINLISLILDHRCRALQPLERLATSAAQVLPLLLVPTGCSSCTKRQALSVATLLMRRAGMLVRQWHTRGVSPIGDELRACQAFPAGPICVTLLNDKTKQEVWI